jgi:hypothetical protein
MRYRLTVLLCVLLLSITGGICGGWGTVTHTSPNRSGSPQRYWVSVHLDRGGWSSFPSERAWVYGQRTWVWGCPDATHYVERPWVW